VLGSVEDDFASQWKDAILGTDEVEHSKLINMKFCINDCVCKLTKAA
jgi:hypothetical protein